MSKKKQLVLLIVLDAFALALLVSYPFYLSYVAEHPRTGVCFFKHFFRLYCVTCGGTRAVSYLLSGAIFSALKANALVVLAVAYGLFFNIFAIISYIRGREKILPFKPSHCAWIILIIFAFTVLRNVLLYAFHFDPLGDLL